MGKKVGPFGCEFETNKMPILFLFLTLIWLPSVLMREILYDSLVSNHGARIRLLANFKSLDLNIKSPDEIGGVKSVEYNKLSIQVMIRYQIEINKYFNEI